MCSIYKSVLADWRTVETMKTVLLFSAFLTIAAAQVPRPMYIDMPVFPKSSPNTGMEWEEIQDNQLLPAGHEDFSAVPAGIEAQPVSSGMVFPPPKSHIVNGRVAYPGQFPWQAAISMDDSNFCGGSLISQKVVLTAGHCVDNFKTFKATLGAHFIREKESTQIVQVTTESIVHAEYFGENVRSDIAVLLFKNNFPLTDHINTIALPTMSMASEHFEGHTMTVSGWGRRDISSSISPVLNYVQLPVLPNKKCAKYYGKVVRSNNICCDGGKRRGTCNGDSGGPLTVNKNGTEFLVGIVSFGSRDGCDIGYPSVFTRVTSYLAWIQRYAGIKIQN